MECIFVPAKIIYIQKLPEKNLVRCGVAYTMDAQTKSQS
jgi:hypothetical protein